MEKCRYEIRPDGAILDQAIGLGTPLLSLCISCSKVAQISAGML